MDHSATRLLCFFFWVASGAAADCPKLQGGKNMVLTNSALLKNGFPEGTEVAFECATGYEIESGSGTMTCTGGNWTDLDLHCKKKDCGPPTALPNMLFEFGSAGTLFGATVKVLCDVGYKLSGSSFKQCYATGWIGRAKCHVVTCPMPGVVSNGRHTWEKAVQPTFGEIVHYVCDDGYTLHGNGSIECRENSKYSSPPPECKGGTNAFTTQESFTLRETFAKTTVHGATSAPLTPAQGAKDILTTEDTNTATSGATTPSSHTTAKPREIEANEDSGNTAVIASVIGTVIVVLILLAILCRFLKKRKGSLNGTVDIY